SGGGCVAAPRQLTVSSCPGFRLRQGFGGPAPTSSAKTRFALLPGHVGNEHFGCVADSDITAILCREPVIFRIAAAGQISDPCVRHGPRQAEPEPTPFLEANGKA